MTLCVGYLKILLIPKQRGLWDKGLIFTPYPQTGIGLILGFVSSKGMRQKELEDSNRRESRARDSEAGGGGPGIPGSGREGG